MRWNPSGRLIASASEDGSVKVIDFVAGKVVETRVTGIHYRIPDEIIATSDWSAKSVCFL